LTVIRISLSITADYLKICGHGKLHYDSIGDSAILLISQHSLDRSHEQYLVTMGRLATIATCQLNQWVLDFDGNRDRIIEAIVEAKNRDAKLILTPELCIPGYGLLDHFLELDVYTHSWEVVAEIISHPKCQDIIIDLGLPVRHREIPSTPESSP